MMISSPAENASRSAASSVFRSTNPHCLEHIVSLAERHEVVADVDIHDSKGVKLWAKGLPVSRKLQERLAQRSLARPLESSLSVGEGASLDVVVADALQVLDANPFFVELSGAADARGLLRDVRKLPLPGPIKLLLTSIRSEKNASYLHVLSIMVVCAGLASRLGLGARDSSVLLFAALVHDIGELYVNPEYLSGNQPLKPADWKHVAAHPCVGYAFVREFTSFPAAVSQCVLHHHERLDGSGYPFQIAGMAVDRLSTILAVADAVSSISTRGAQGMRERIEVALRIGPEEFERDVTSIIDTVAHKVGDAEAGSPENRGLDLESVRKVLLRFEQTRKIAESLLSGAPPENVKAEVNYVLSVLGNIQKNLHATGVSDPAQLVAIGHEPGIAGEIRLIVGGVSWRLRNLARNLHMRIEKSCNPDDIRSVAGLIAVLDPAA